MPLEAVVRYSESPQLEVRNATTGSSVLVSSEITFQGAVSYPNGEVKYFSSCPIALSEEDMQLLITKSEGFKRAFNMVMTKMEQNLAPIHQEDTSIERVSNAGRKKRSGVPGWVYLLRTVGSPTSVKIGVTTASRLATRVESIATNSPLPIAFVGAIKVEDALSVEKELHEIFKKDRVNREWFMLHPSEVIKEMSAYGTFTTNLQEAA